MLDIDESTIVDKDVISTQIGSLVNETEKCSKEELSHSLDLTEHAIEPKQEETYFSVCAFIPPLAGVYFRN